VRATVEAMLHAGHGAPAQEGSTVGQGSNMKEWRPDGKQLVGLKDKVFDGTVSKTKAFIRAWDTAKEK
jgi:hypothetical protein